MCFHACNSGELSSIQEDNPLYEEQEIRMEMFQGSDNETEGKSILVLEKLTWFSVSVPTGDLDEVELLAAALQDDDEDEDNSTTAIWSYGILPSSFVCSKPTFCDLLSKI